ncbi:hypothetical protein AMECASPLE_039157 [Ameca splendens]|uniref:Uncharacterized protein n=1 Tax=Ameca splendens TaxID=208324 RepID=A0ABV0XLF0_9TELE
MKRVFSVFFFFFLQASFDVFSTLLVFDGNNPCKLHTRKHSFKGELLSLQKENFSPTDMKQKHFRIK